MQSGKLQPKKLVTHRFAMNYIIKAYNTFGNAAKDGALKVVLNDDGAELRRIETNSETNRFMKGEL